MKKFTVILLTFCIIFCGTVCGTAEKPGAVYAEENTGSTEDPTQLPAFPKGDVNFNYRIDAGDARQVLRVSAGLSSCIDIKWSYHADYNGDGKVTAQDARMILRVSAGLSAR